MISKYIRWEKLTEAHRSLGHLYRKKEIFAIPSSSPEKKRDICLSFLSKTLRGDKQMDTAVAVTFLAINTYLLKIAY